MILTLWTGYRQPEIHYFKLAAIKFERGFVWVFVRSPIIAFVREPINFTDVNNFRFNTVYGTGIYTMPIKLQLI